MCGRYSLTKLPETEVLVNEDGDVVEWEPRYNIAPTNLCPIKSMHRPDVLQLYRWGLIPFWAKDEKIGYRMINARAETLAEKPSFRNALEKGRCLVFADGFYEWKGKGKEKQPYRIHIKEKEPFMMAGLTERWQAPSGEIIHSFTIITTEPNVLTSEVHDRMPVILDPDSARHWLSLSIRKEDALGLLQTYPADGMDMYQVDRAVGNVRNDFPELIAPLNPQ